MNRERKIAPDLARILAAMAVIIMHITSLIYYELGTLGYKWWMFSNAINWGLKWSTPFFVMISGYFLLNSRSSNDYKVFFKRRFRKIIIPYIFWSLIYYLLIQTGNQDILYPLDFLNKLWHSGTYYHLYYINVILGLYIATPFIKKYVLKMNLNFVVPILFIGSICYLAGYTYFGFPQVDNIFTWFLPYLGYYIAGYWMGSIPAPRSSLIYLLNYLGLMLITILVTRKTFFVFNNQEMQTVLVKHFSPTIIIISLSLFYVVINIKNSILRSIIDLSSLSHLSLGVYFIHPLWIEFFRNLSVFRSLYISHYGAWLLSMVLLCVLGSFSSVFFLKKIPYLKYLV